MSSRVRVLFGTALAAGLAMLLVAQHAPAADPVADNLPAKQWPWKPLTLPRALVVVGPWGDEFRWREALHEQGILYEDGYRVQNGYHRPNVWMVNVPTTDAELAEFSVVVLINVDAPALGPERLTAIERFVARGGGLVVLGGYWAFSRGGYADTPLEKLLPVSFPPENRIPARTPGAILSPEKADWLKADFEARPRVFFYQHIEPKPGAEIAIRAGDAPALVTGSFGKGRVAACGLTVNGKPSEDELAFWDWDQWPRVLGQTVEWAAANRPLKDPTEATARTAPLSNDEIEQVKLDFQEIDETFLARFVAAPRLDAAEVVFEHWFGDEPAAGVITPTAIDALVRFAQATWQERLLKASDGLNADRGRRRAALELLGATRTPEAAKVLLAALADDDVAPAAVDGLRRYGSEAHRPTLLKLYQQQLPQADFHNPAAEATNDAAATRHGVLAVHAAAALYHLGDPEGTERMAKLYAEIRLLRRIYANATKRRVVETDPTGIAVRNAIVGKMRDFAVLEELLLTAAGPVPYAQRASFGALAKEAADESEIRWFTAGMFATPAAKWQLDDAKDGTIRRLSDTLK